MAPHQYPIFIAKIREKTGFPFTESYAIVQHLVNEGRGDDDLRLRRFLKANQLDHSKKTLEKIAIAIDEAELSI